MDGGCVGGRWGLGGATVEQAGLPPVLLPVQAAITHPGKPGRRSCSWPQTSQQMLSQQLQEAWHLGAQPGAEQHRKEVHISEGLGRGPAAGLRGVCPWTE